MQCLKTQYEVTSEPGGIQGWALKSAQTFQPHSCSAVAAKKILENIFGKLNKSREEAAVKHGRRTLFKSRILYRRNAVIKMSRARR
jgi:hypothetical protein